MANQARGIFPQAMFDLCRFKVDLKKHREFGKNLESHPLSINNPRLKQRPQNEEIQYGRFPSGYSISGEGLIDAYMHPILLS